MQNAIFHRFSAVLHLIERTNGEEDNSEQSNVEIKAFSRTTVCMGITKSFRSIKFEKLRFRNCQQMCKGSINYT
jgi:hypothetical protein